MFVFLLVVLRFCVDPGTVRDGRETSFPALEGRLRARGGGFGGGPGGPPNPITIYVFIAIQTSATNWFPTTNGHGSTATNGHGSTAGDQNHYEAI